MKNPLMIVFLFALFVFVSSTNPAVPTATGDPAEAKCAIRTFDNEYEYAKAVFVGEVTGEEKDGDKTIFEFKVKKFWKGIEDTKVKVAVYENPRFQAPFDVGETHLVFAKENEDSGELWDGRCSRSKDLNGFSSDLKDDLKKLGEGKTCISLDDKEKEEKKKQN